MPCLRANASARPRSRAATAATVTSGTRVAGLTSAVGAMAAAPRIPIRTLSTRGNLPWRAERHPRGGLRTVAPMTDADARRFAHESLAVDDPTGWFERLYMAAADGTAVVPWDRGMAN